MKSSETPDFKEFADRVIKWPNLGGIFLPLMSHLINAHSMLCPNCITHLWSVKDIAYGVVLTIMSGILFARFCIVNYDENEQKEYQTL